jgi:hypothetical protein
MTKALYFVGSVLAILLVTFVELPSFYPGWAVYPIYAISAVGIIDALYGVVKWRKQGAST